MVEMGMVVLLLALLLVELLLVLLGVVLCPWEPAVEAPSVLLLLGGGSVVVEPTGEGLLCLVVCLLRWESRGLRSM